MEMLFSCGQCGQQMTIDSQYAGLTTSCPNCQAEIAIPAAEAAAVPAEAEKPSFRTARQTEEEKAAPERLEPKKRCPHCGSDLASDQAVVCLECGHDSRSKAGKAVKKTGKIGLAVTVAAIAALVSGLIWAGIAILLEMEIGYIAILVGIITGGAIRLLTPERSVRMGLIAVVLAVGGILLGKIIAVEYFLHDSDSDAIFSEMFDPEKINLEEEDDLETVVADYLLEKGELKDPFTEVIALNRAGMAPDDPKYAAALDRMDAVVEANDEIIESRLENLSEAEQKIIRERCVEVLYLDVLYDRMEAAGEVEKLPEAEYETDDDGNLTPRFRKALVEYTRVLEANKLKVREKYRQLTEPERLALQEETRQLWQTRFQSYVRVGGFLGSFGFLDVIFFLCAMAAAWQMATKEQLGKAG